MIIASPTPENTSLLYLAPGDVLKGRVEPTIWMRMCQSFGKLGLDVELVSLYTYRRENIRRDNIFEHYGIEHPSFSLRILPTPLTLRSPLLWYRACTVTANFLHAVKRGVLLGESRSRKNLIIYSRGPAAIYPYLRLRNLFARYANVLYVFETHVLPAGKLAIRVVKETDGVVVSSKKLAHDMQARLQIPADRLQRAYLASNAISFNFTRDDACRRLGLPLGKQYITYTGKLLMGEVHLLLDVAQKLSTILPAAELVFVGGNPKILAECRSAVAQRGLENVRFAGFVAPSEVALYQEAADVLILSLTRDREIIDYITPSKVFDYLQAGRPIVVSDYPILHEILEHGRNAYFVPPHAPTEFAEAIKRVLEDAELKHRLSEGARISAQNYSWECRVNLIWAFIQRLNEMKCRAHSDRKVTMSLNSAGERSHG